MALRTVGLVDADDSDRRSLRVDGYVRPVRVVAGTAGGRRLVAPPGTDTRPTTDRVREAMFNALESLGAVDGARVLDLFAGSGRARHRGAVARRGLGDVRRQPA